jgi:hypothetical protein
MNDPINESICKHLANTFATLKNKNDTRANKRYEEPCGGFEEVSLTTLIAFKK